jgi:hypothetical protein
MAWDIVFLMPACTKGQAGLQRSRQGRNCVVQRRGSQRRVLASLTCVLAINSSARLAMRHSLCNCCMLPSARGAGSSLLTAVVLLQLSGDAARESTEGQLRFRGLVGYYGWALCVV